MEHRITARSVPIGRPWYDRWGREWREYSCGVTGHECGKTIKTRTGNKLK